MEDLANHSEVPSSSKAEDQKTREKEVKESSPAKPSNSEFYFNEGKQLLLHGEHEKAIEMLCQALELAIQAKGEMDQSLANYYFTYADALLTQYEKENGDKIFGEQVPEQVPRSVSSSQHADEASDSQPVSKNESETPDESKNESEIPEDSKNHENVQAKESSVSGSDSEAEESDESNEESFENEENQPENHENEPGKSENDSFNPESPQLSPAHQAEKTEENTDDLQLAWENLDTARVILTKAQSPNSELLTNIYRRLAEVNVFKEDFSSACEEYQNALSILQATQGLMPSRQKAEIHYLIGLYKLQIKGSEQEAADEFSYALANLEGVMLAVASPEERQELLSVIQDIKMKKEDALEQKESISALEQLKNTSVNLFDNPVIQLAPENVQVKRKMKPQADPEFPESSDNKKRTEE